MVLRSELLIKYGFPCHGFTTRFGGVSKDHFEAFNFATSTGDSDICVQQNFSLLADRLEVPVSCIQSVTQIHSTEIAILEKPFGKETLKLSLPQADAIIDMTGTWVVGVKTADCVPLLLADPRSRMVCAVHAGWRGIVARIVPRVLKVLHKHVGTNDWIVAIGPHIRACHFQVGAEVAEHFVRSSVRSDPRREGAFLVDLSKSLHTQLEEQGIPEAHIEILPYCTHCLPKFFSHRRSQGRCGRMFNFVSGRV